MKEEEMSGNASGSADDERNEKKKAVESGNAQKTDRPPRMRRIPPLLVACADKRQRAYVRTSRFIRLIHSFCHRYVYRIFSDCFLLHQSTLHVGFLAYVPRLSTGIQNR